MREGMITVDSHGFVTSLNPAGEGLLGWSAAELIGRRLHQTIHYKRGHDTKDEGAHGAILEAIESGSEYREPGDFFVHRDGSDLPVDVSATTLPAGEAVVIFSDRGKERTAELRHETNAVALHWLREIRDALDEDRFVVFAQPAIDLKSGEVRLHELLIRMRDREGALANPGEFLPVAEEFGMIADIDRWMVGQAAWLASRGHRVSVNLSAHSVGSSKMVEHFMSVLDEHRADPKLIVVELTETALLEDEDSAIDFITAIKLIGCEFALDDFGTGYGGFSYIKRLPVDHLKIDMEFVRDLMENEGSRNVVQAVVNLARGFGHSTIAEGVESDDVLAALRDYGVDLAQGYGIARPAPAAEAFGDLEREGSVQG